MNNSFKRSLLLTTVLLTAEPMSAAYADDCGQQIQALQSQLANLKANQNKLNDDALVANNARNRRISQLNAQVASDKRTRDALQKKIPKDTDNYNKTKEKWDTLINLPDNPTDRKMKVAALDAFNKADKTLSDDTKSLNQYTAAIESEEKEIASLQTPIKPDPKALKDLNDQQIEVNKQITALQATCKTTPSAPQPPAVTPPPPVMQPPAPKPPVTPPPVPKPPATNNPTPQPSLPVVKNPPPPVISSPTPPVRR